MNIEILAPDLSETRLSVETWWYDGSTLILEYTTGETEQFPNGNVVKRLS